MPSPTPKEIGQHLRQIATSGNFPDTCDKSAPNHTFVYPHSSFKIRCKPSRDAILSIAKKYEKFARKRKSKRNFYSKSGQYIANLEHNKIR